MDKPIISYVIPCYNCETTIYDAIESIKVSHETIRKNKKLPSLWNQIEVIAVDDGSTDLTLDIINAMASVHPNIRAIPLGFNKGKGIARNTGNQAAQADIIAVLDSDDWNIHDRTDTIIKYFNNNPDCDVFYSSYIARHIYNGYQEFKKATKIDENNLKEFGTFLIGHSTVAYRKQAILEKPYSEDRNKDDWSMLWNFWSNGYKFCFYADQPLVAYRITQEDIIRAENQKAAGIEQKLKSKKMLIVEDYFNKLKTK